MENEKLKIEGKKNLLKITDVDAYNEKVKDD